LGKNKSGFKFYEINDGDIIFNEQLQDNIRT